VTFGNGESEQQGVFLKVKRTLSIAKQSWYDNVVVFSIQPSWVEPIGDDFWPGIASKLKFTQFIDFNSLESRYG
jgi:hypothetical protein